MDDESLDAAFRHATSLRDDGDLAGAAAVLESLGQAHPRAFVVWLVLGGVQAQRRDYAASEIALSIAVHLRPRSELASLALFHTLKHLGRVDDAFGEMRRFLALRPESHEYAGCGLSLMRRHVRHLVAVPLTHTSCGLVERVEGDSRRERTLL